MTEHQLACAGSTILLGDICDLAWYVSFQNEWVEWCCDNNITYDPIKGVFNATDEQKFLIKMRWSS